MPLTTIDITVIICTAMLVTVFASICIYELIAGHSTRKEYNRLQRAETKKFKALLASK